MYKKIDISNEINDLERYNIFFYDDVLEYFSLAKLRILERVLHQWRQIKELKSISQNAVFRKTKNTTLEA